VLLGVQARRLQRSKQDLFNTGPALGPVDQEAALTPPEGMSG